MAQNIISERWNCLLSKDPATGAQFTLQAGINNFELQRLNFEDTPFEKYVYTKDANGSTPVLDFDKNDLLLIKRFRFVTPLLSVGLCGYNETKFLPDGTFRVRQDVYTYHRSPSGIMENSDMFSMDRSLMLGEWCDINSTLKWYKSADRFRLGIVLSGTHFRLDATRVNAAFIGAPLNLFAEIELSHTLPTVAP